MPRVLFAEDSPDSVGLLRIQLNKAPFDWEIALTGLEALALYRVARRDGKPYDLLVFDVAMPMQTGTAALRQLQDEGDKTPAILATALDDGEVDDEGLAVMARFRKPGAYENIVEKVTNALEKRSYANS
jgi:CheY-like chemotaxis protein